MTSRTQKRHLYLRKKTSLSTSSPRREVVLLITTGGE